MQDCSLQVLCRCGFCSSFLSMRSCMRLELEASKQLTACMRAPHVSTAGHSALPWTNTNRMERKRLCSLPQCHKHKDTKNKTHVKRQQQTPPPPSTSMHACMPLACPTHSSYVQACSNASTMDHSCRKTNVDLPPSYATAVRQATQGSTGGSWDARSACAVTVLEARAVSHFAATAPQQAAAHQATDVKPAAALSPWWHHLDNCHSIMLARQCLGGVEL